MKIFIAASLEQGEGEDPKDKVLETAVTLTRAGYSVYLPHLFDDVCNKSEELGVGINRHRRLAIELEWLEACNVLLVVGSSERLQGYVAYAKRHTIPICYSIRELIDGIGDIIESRR